MIHWSDLSILSKIKDKNMNKKQIIILFTISMLVIGGLLIWRNFLYNDVEYQLNMLTSGSTEQKLFATDKLGEKKILSAIPFLMMNIDNFDGTTYKNKSPESVSCVTTLALIKITMVRTIGDTCCYYECDQKNKTILEKWRSWYKNEYPMWLENQKEVK